jgi:thioredoxin-like negative regulator of GroEL
LAPLLLLAALACAGSAAYDAALRRGEMALAVGDPEHAEGAYREALQARPRDAAALLGLARSYMAREDCEAALEIFAGLELAAPEVFAEARADHLNALERAAAARLERGDPAGALRLLRRLAERDPGRAGVGDALREAILAEASRLLLTGRADSAEELFREGLERQADSVEAVLGLAQALIERGRVDDAIRLLSDAAVRHPQDARIEELMDRAVEIRYPSQPAKRSSSD